MYSLGMHLRADAVVRPRAHGTFHGEGNARIVRRSNEEREVRKYQREEDWAKTRTSEGERRCQSSSERLLNATATFVRPRAIHRLGSR